jgi:spore coat protein U-like protein
MNGKWLIALLPIVVGLLAIVPVIKADDITVTAEVPPYVSVVFNYNTVNFGNVAPGSTDVPAPNQDSGIYNVSVTTNVRLYIYASRTPWSPSDVLTLKFAVLTSVPFGSYIGPEIDTSSRLITGIAPGSYTTYHGYWLTVPSNTPAGTYSTTVTITYTPA